MKNIDKFGIIKYYYEWGGMNPSEFLEQVLTF